VKEATGVAAIVIVFEVEVLPTAFFTVKVIVYVPASLNVWETFLVVARALLSPKFQDQEVGVLVLVSVNVMGLVVVPDVVDAVKDAIGSTGMFGEVAGFGSLSDDG
jgi:hypothetical protein